MPVDADLIVVYEQWQNTDKVHINLTAGDAYRVAQAVEWLLIACLCKLKTIITYESSH